MALQLLTVGEHPNLAFYAWRLQATKSCAVTVVSDTLDLLAPMHWQSKQLGNSVFKPHFQVSSVAQLDPKTRYDVVLLSVSNLQSFQDSCASLAPYLHSQSLVVVESSGYVLLEPFVVSSFPKDLKINVCSIMNEADVKRYPHSNELAHSVLNQDQRIYLGTCTSDQKALGRLLESEYYAKFYKLLQLVQEQLGGYISLLRSNNYKEFMTYQWKLALPRIVLNPLSVIFEEPYPANLDKQILAKPLILGLVNEIFKIIKKMECKLIKGFENEANILKNWLAHFPVSHSPVVPEFRNTNPVFYNFYHQLDVDVDLLLLQPILLGDDHGVRTPYLENLYLIVCQLLKMNIAESIFFTRKTQAAPHSDKHVKEIAGVQHDLASLRLEKENVEAQYKERLARMNLLEATLTQRQQAQDVLVQKFEEQTRLYDTKIAELARIQQQRLAELAELDGHLAQKQSTLKNLDSKILNAEAAWGQQQKKLAETPNVKPAAAPEPAESSRAPVSNGGGAVNSQASNTRTVDLLHMETPDLSDFADIAMYGASLEEDALPQKAPLVPQVPPPPHNSVSQNGPVKVPEPLSEKERELQRREQALLERERELRASLYPPPQPNSDPYYDTQTGEQFHDVSSGHHDHNGNPNGNPNGMYYGNSNGSVNSNINGGGQNYRQPHSYAGGNAQFDGNGYDQRPPHGLPPNGFPQNSLPPNLRNPQRYQQNGQPFNQQMAQQRPRVQSHPSGPPGMNYPGQQLQPHLPQQSMPGQSGGPHNMPQHRANSMAYQPQMNPHPQMQTLGSHQYSLNLGAHGAPHSAPHSAPQGYSGKKNNRRSAFPDQGLNIDYGGRGGMPMPTANGAKHKSVMMAASGAQSSPPTAQQKKTFPGTGPSIQTQAPAHLRIPHQTSSSNSDSLASHGSINEGSPKPTTPDGLGDIRLEVPVVEAAAKPLGGIAPPLDGKKKKRGFLKKH